MIKKTNHILLITGICIILFSIPNLFWFNNLYNLGGDDTMLYYLFPSEMIKNYIFNLASDNGLSVLGGYAVQFYQFPFFLLLSIAQTVLPFVNIQTVFYGANLALGFLFFYLFIGIWIKNTSIENVLIKILTGFTYVFSLFSYYDLWSSLFVLYLISIFPLILYLFFKAIIENKIVYLVADALLISLFSILILSTPWLALGIIAVLPLLFLLFLQYKKRFLVFSSVFALLVFLLNFYWIFFFFFPVFSPQENKTSNILSYITETSSLEGADNNIKIVTEKNNLIYPILNLVHKDIQISFDWQNYKIFSGWHEKFLLVNLIFAIVIILAGFMIKKTSQTQRWLYLTALFGWIIILYFYTVKIGDIGLNIFLWMNHHIPGFVMFRNSYGKIAPGFPFIYALLIGISIKIIFDNLVNKKIKIIALIAAIFFVILNAKPFIANEYFSTVVWTTKNTYTTLQDFNPEFYQLIEMLKKSDDPSRMVWLPLSIISYIHIKDTTLPNHYYIAPSPLLFLSQKQDLSGLSGMPPGYAKEYSEALTRKDYDTIGKVFQKLNINYIIWNDDISQDLRRSFLFSRYPKDTFYELHHEKSFQENLLGKKLYDNKRYQLFAINPKYKSSKISLISEASSKSSTVIFTKESSSSYTLSLKNLKEKSRLFFLDGYSPYWTLYTKGTEVKIPYSSHDVIYNYANSWSIDPAEIKQKVDKKYYTINSDGSISMDIKLSFFPVSYFPAVFSVSILSLIFSAGFIVIKMIRRKKPLTKKRK